MKEKFNIVFVVVVIGLFNTLFPSNNLLAQACPGLGSITLNVVAAPQPTLNAPAQLCPGVNGTIAVNQTFSTYAWNTSGTGQSIAISNPGTYTVTVTNAAGCSATATANVAAAPAPAPNITQNTYACNGQIVLNAGGGFSTYSWSNSGGSNPTATYTTAGTYTVTVTNAQGCTGTDDFTVTIPTPPVVGITGNLNICAGEGTTLSATPGFTTYSWTGGGSSANLPVSTGGTYTVTATDAFGCTDTESATVVAATSPTPTVADANICPGASVTLSVSNAPFQSYNWNNSSTTATTVANAPGIYTVTVTAANGCTGTTTANVALLPAPNPNVVQLTYACNGQFVLDAGPGFTTYTWSNSTGNQTTTVNGSGNYTVTVTNGLGCTGTDDINVSIPTPPVVSISGDNSFCSGDAAALNATPGFVTYAWNSGQNSANINVTGGGTFTVTATDNFGCTATDNFTVTQLAAPQPLVVGPAQVCPGSTVTFSTSVNFPSYNWSNGESTPTITVGTAGPYTVTVTAANGCTGTNSLTLSLLPAPNPNITQATYACNGQLILNAGAGFATYTWSNAASTPTTTVNASGNYTVTVSNAQGCTATDVFFANIPAPPVVSITGDNSFCDGASADLNASPGLVTYVWNTSQNGPNITTVSGGTFTVTATDAFGCTATDNFTVAELPAPIPVITGATTVCAGVTATFSTTTGFVAYNWSNSQTTPTITVGTAGVYTVTVTAANGCTGTDTQALGVTPAPAPNITAAPYDCNDQLTLNAGTGFTSYTWSNAANTPTSVVTANGTYTVTVTNAQGCTGTDTYLADIPVPPFVDITGNAAICPGSSTTLAATPGYSNYLWSNTSNNPNISVSTAGNFTVTVTDASGCTASDEFSVSALTGPAPNISGPSQICATGSATFSVPGTFTAFNWSTGVNTPTITVNTANTYTVTVTAANGCTGTDTQTLTISNSLQPQITQLPYTCNGQITLDAGSGFNSYSWSGGQNAQSITVTADDTYTVTVSDAGGCTGTAVAIVTLPAPPAVDIAGSNSICAGTSTTLSATAGLNAYLWSTAQVGANISASAAGTYTVTATDALGCTATDEFVLANTPAPQPDITGPTVICTNSTGTLALAGTFTQYNWSTGETTSTINIAAGNTYGVTVTDAQGCTGTDAQLVTEVTGLAPVLTQLPYACSGTQTLDAGSGFSSYLWSDGQKTSAITVNAAGTYSITVTDASGCTGTGTLDVAIPVAPVVAISGKTSFCQNENTTLDATPGFASYVWSDGQTTSTVTVNQGIVFTLTVTDALGCTDTESIAVTANPLPQPQIVGPAALCGTGTATISVSQNYAAYAWSNGINTAFSVFDSPGAYTVTVTDANGCTGTDESELTVNPVPVPVVLAAPYACDGQIALDAGAGFLKYEWSGPNGFIANSQQPTVNVSGTYTVTVSDVNTCTGTATSEVVVPALNQVSVTGATQFCKGGSVELEASTGFVKYVWSDGQVLSNITASAVGAYVVTATDAQGCTSTAEAIVSTFAEPVPVISGPTTVCPGNTATLSVVGTFTNVAWSNGPTTAEITIQPPFTATVTVTDSNGCTGTASASVVVSNQLSPNIVQQPYACDGQITLDAGTGFQKYQWGGPGGFTATSQQSKVNVSGTYTVTVSDGSGCSGTATVEVKLPVLPQVALSGDTQLCPSETSTLTATAGFSAYAWSSGSILPTAEVNAAGTYTVTATDALGCTATATLAIQSLTPPAPGIAGPATICGSNPIALNVTGGPFSGIQWSNADVTPGISVNAAGTYSVTVTDGNGCTGTAEKVVQTGGSLSVNIAQILDACDALITLVAGAGFQKYEWSGPNGFTASDQQPTVTVAGIYTVTVTDAGGCSGTATSEATILTLVTPQVDAPSSLCPAASGTATVVNAQNFATFEWNTGETTPLITGVVGGKTYTVTVSDANGCTQTVGFNIQLAATPTPSVTSLPYTCNGQITLDAGSGFATYAWSNGANTQVATFNQTGAYTVTVTNNLACPGTATAQVVIPPNPVVSISGTTTICSGSSTTLTASAGFTGYTWSNGLNTPNATFNQPGTYTVTATNANGCTATATATLQAGSLIPALQSNEVFCQGTSLTISVTGSYAGYVWSNGSTQSSLTVSQVGTYTVTVTDIAGCTGSATSQVLAVPPASVSISGNTTICGTNSANLTTTGSAGTFEWSNGATGVPFITTQAGTYTVTVTDANGCTATDSETIVASAPVTATVQRISCRIQEAGTQTFTLTAANGCDSVLTIITKYQPTKPGLALDSQPVINAKIGQVITLNITANFPIDSVAYQSPFTLSCTNCVEPSLTAIASGFVQITAFDEGGCQASEQVRVLVSKTVDIYVPNIFIPGSGANGFFSVYSGPEITSVRNFSVFDRWGNGLFSRADMPTNDPSAGWDGTFRNQKMQPGVYVYYFEIELADGSVEVRSGDVTIVE